MLASATTAIAIGDVPAVTLHRQYLAFPGGSLPWQNLTTISLPSLDFCYRLEVTVVFHGAGTDPVPPHDQAFEAGTINRQCAQPDSARLLRRHDHLEGGTLDLPQFLVERGNPRVGGDRDGPGDAVIGHEHAVLL